MEQLPQSTPRALASRRRLSLAQQILALPAEIRALPVDILPIRLAVACSDGGLRTIGDLATRDLSGFRNVGRKSLADLPGLLRGGAA